MDNELKAYLEAMEHRLDAKIERVETTLLTEFHKHASPNEARMRTRIAVLEMERVEKLAGPAAS
jgi:hypothetical protein